MQNKKKITPYRVFSVFNVIFMLLLILVTAYPVYYIVIASFSDPGALSRHVGLLWMPMKPYTLSAYEMVFRNPRIITGLLNTLFVLGTGLLINLTLTMLGAFFLTIKGPMLKNAIALMIIFTMYFSGGMIPGYLNIRDLKLLDTLWALVLPGAVSTANLIIMKSGFQSIPDSLIESARLDGGSYLQILLRVMIPLSKATIAVMVLYYGVGHWNAWFNASIYLRDSDKFPLQLVVRNILKLAGSSAMASGAGMDEMAQMAELIKYALIVVTTTPILVLYPFLQKYFVKGVMVGAIKG
ncbi:MAG: carbohydrate ABC transporter permease [Lachnospiraceae bacterium]|jgi:putative aldouronate transport system permease protein|nr:carbohydrate ABC transporter permease [uncultured Acetatifactor sp.]MCI9220233.1 carbohydrate ABC transporter permease [Lachnospiraceae bacterium]